MAIVPDSSGGGNTKTPPQISPALHWFFTWNNYPDDWKEKLEFQSSKISKYIYGKEVGASGTPHIQGNISFKSKVRPKNLFPADIHWEKTKKLSSAVEYCSKDGEYFSKGYTLPYKEDITDLYGWEKDLCDIIETEPDKRTIYWRWSEQGDIGKTTFCKYLYTHYEKVVVLGGKADDMRNGIIQYEDKNGFLPVVVIIDIPRCSNDHVSWAGIESVKNMFFYSGKYEGGMICGKCPHVICFANCMPDMEKLSSDRWNIAKLD